MRSGLLTVAIVGWAAIAHAQGVVNPTTVQFTPPADQALVMRYDLQIYLVSAPDVSYRIVPLGKPPAGADGTITVIFAALTPYPLPEGIYQARVVAWKETEAGVSEPSNVFTFATSSGDPPPMKPTGITATVKIGG